MKGILLDTNILSALRDPVRNRPVVDSVAAYSGQELYLSSITIGEVAKGVALLAPGRKRDSVARWLGEAERVFAPRILSVDTNTSKVWGELVARLQLAGRPLPGPDGLIAATALYHDLVLMTRNVKDFERTGVALIDPYADGKRV